MSELDLFFGSKKARRAGGSSSSYKKPAGRPKIKPEDGCTVVDGWNGDKHVYTMFGAPKECCVKCGKEHARITEWRNGILDGSIKNEGHPYVVSGFWSLAEYKVFMKR